MLNYIFFGATIIIQILTLNFTRRLFDERGDVIKQRAAYFSFELQSIFLLVLIFIGLFFGMKVNNLYLGMMLLSLVSNIIYLIILYFGDKNA